MNLRLNRLTEALTFSLFKSFTFISLLFPFLKHFLSKTLDLFSMDAMLFDYDDVFDRPLSRPYERLSDIDHADQLYLVHYRWWNEARESLFSSDVTGVLYATRSSLSRAANGWDGDELDPEIVMDMRRDVAESSEEGGSVSVSGCEYALVLEWMFLRALKWHNDLEEVGTIVAAGYTMQDLFSLKIRLSFVRKTNVLFAKICQKDNEVGAFNKACNIFCLESGLFRIWDFSGQITQFCIDSRKLSDDLVLQNEEVEVKEAWIRVACLAPNSYMIPNSKSYHPPIMQKYGGGPTLARKIISFGLSQIELYVEVYPLRLQLYLISKGDQSAIRISKKETVGELHKNACKIFDLYSEQTCIWDYFSY